MHLITDSGKKISLRNCKKPKFSERNGKVWDNPTTFYIDNIEINPAVDMAHGIRFYFEYLDKWYSGMALDLNEIYFKENCKMIKN